MRLVNSKYIPNAESAGLADRDSLGKDRWNVVLLEFFFFFSEQLKE